MFCSKLTEQVLVTSDYPVVETKYGRIAGLKKDGTYIFRGIKYADAERFHMPIKVKAWEGIKAAVTYGYVCPELTTPIPLDQQFNPHYFMPQDEDCQYLNIWTQSIDKSVKKPVMVWMHGGGWFGGSGVEQYAYDGEELSKFGDVVVVSFNHRLNCLGGLDLSGIGEEYELSGYCAVADVLALLHWVKENIEVFGGDSENITVFGQSGGVAKVLFAMQMPAADGLFQKAAVSSGGIREQAVPEGWTKKRLAQRMGELTVEALGITKANLKNIETIAYWDLADAVIRAEKKLKEESGLKEAWRWEPVPDGKIIAGSTLENGFRKETKKIPMLIGNVFGEANSNMLPENRIRDESKNKWSLPQIETYCKERFGDMWEMILTEFCRIYPENHPSDVLFMDYKERDGQLDLIQKRLEAGGDTWNWLFKRESPINGGTVAWHCSELPFVFHNASYIEASFEPGISENLENIMAGVWVAFAKNGDPNIPGQIPKWDKATGIETPTMIFDKKCAVRKNHDVRLRQLLKAADERNTK